MARSNVDFNFGDIFNILSKFLFEDVNPEPQGSLQKSGGTACPKALWLPRRP
jgi:hypothetical protein